METNGLLFRELVAAFDEVLGPVLSPPERMESALKGRDALCERLAACAIPIVVKSQWNALRKVANSVRIFAPDLVTELIKRWNWRKGEQERALDDFLQVLNKPQPQPKQQEEQA